MPSSVQLHFRPPGQPEIAGRWSAFREIVTCDRVEDVPACLARLDAALAAGSEAVGFLAYEAAPGIDPALRTQPPWPGWPLLWFGLDGRREPPPEPPAAGAYTFGEWQPDLDRTAYEAAFQRIRQHLVDGDTYQVNLTFPLRATFQGDPARLYAALRRAQNAAYTAWLHTDEWDLLSASPELFFAWHADRLVTRPMKGTRRRGLTTAADRAIADELRQCPKDRAENVMIVDLLRNDMGRLADIGSVHPVTLFSVEKYPTVWQMTSTIEARVPAHTPFSRLLKGLFPCGSVTGAPKVKTMEIIAGLEPTPRGVYCGAIGYARQGQAAFNVAIRTLQLRHGHARYHVGSGLVIDSDPGAEYTECLDKARVLASAGWPPFDLLETLRWEPGNGFWLLERHLARLADSAAYFDRPCDLAAIRRQLADPPWDTPQRVRLLLAADGQLTIQPFPLTEQHLPRRLRLAPQPVDSSDPFLYHKTTHRRVYETAAACRGDADDVLLWNERGELTEATIANVAVQFDDDTRWLTPPVTSGLLAGTLRAELLDSGDLLEAVIHRDDLDRPHRLQLLNSVRGRQPAVLIRD